MAGDDLQSKAAEMMKRVLTVGVSALFLTEESLRALVTEFKLPKELLGSILDSASRTRKEFLQDLSQDVINRIKDKVDLKAVIHEVLARNDIDLHVRVSFKAKAKPGKAARSPRVDEEDVEEEESSSE